MLGANEIYKHLTQISQHHAKFKKLFDEFGYLAKQVLNEKDCPVAGVVFEEDYANDRFYVRFAGKCVRFALSTDLGSKGSGRASVKCNLVEPESKTVGAAVGSFSFNGQGDTELKLPPDGDEITVSSRGGPAYLVLHMLNEALDKQ